MAILCFFVGTDAELIKLFPVIRRAQQSGVPFRLVATGQNDIGGSTLLSHLGIGPDLVLSEERIISKSAAGLFSWFWKTWRAAPKKIAAAFPGMDFSRAVMVVHGDTVSTVMGAWVGRKLGMHVAHVEAGLRSHSLLNPFPEEIDRLLASRCASLSFAPGAPACDNLKKYKGVVINTIYNTVIDSLAYSRTMPCADPEIQAVAGIPYFVFVLHRQENLMRPTFVRSAFQTVSKQAKSMRCVCLLHKPTEVILQSMGLLDSVRGDKNIVVMRRKAYFDFMKLLDGAEFVITDGGSNQEELSYMGKPCLILRTRTERNDGLGENAVLYQGDVGMIAKFAKEYESYRREPVAPDRSPSEIIVENLQAVLVQSHGE